jgi:hypothetical protein
MRFSHLRQVQSLIRTGSIEGRIPFAPFQMGPHNQTGPKWRLTYLASITITLEGTPKKINLLLNRPNSSAINQGKDVHPNTTIHQFLKLLGLIHNLRKPFVRRIIFLELRE